MGYRRGDPRLAVTGFPKLDPLFRTEDVRTENPLNSLGLKPGRFTLLYAPTWGGVNSSGAWRNDFWPNWEDAGAVLKQVHRILQEQDAQLIVKLHHLSDASVDKVIADVSPSERIVVIRDSPNSIADPLPLIRHCDALISDMSGMITEFIAVDKPVLCLTPKAKFAWNECSIPEDLLPSSPILDVDSFLTQLVRLIKERNNYFADRRHACKQVLFKFADSHSAERATRAIMRRYSELHI
jgi:CDP-glycerol glycerophosphotransferase (TagB/SpsB family)